MVKVKEILLRKFIRIDPFRGYGFAFVFLSAPNPISWLSNQFRKSRIYICSGISRVRTVPREGPTESTRIGNSERVSFHKNRLSGE
jgi:hypothetical protein